MSQAPYGFGIKRLKPLVVQQDLYGEGGDWAYSDIEGTVETVTKLATSLVVVPGEELGRRKSDTCVSRF